MNQKLEKKTEDQKILYFEEEKKEANQIMMTRNNPKTKIRDFVLDEEQIESSFRSSENKSFKVVVRTSARNRHLDFNSKEISISNKSSYTKKPIILQELQFSPKFEKDRNLSCTFESTKLNKIGNLIYLFFKWKKLIVASNFISFFRLKYDLS